MSEWISVKDKPLPKKGTWIIAWNGIRVIAMECYYYHQGEAIWNHITHWMPFPNPPENK